MNNKSSSGDNGKRRIIIGLMIIIIIILLLITSCNAVKYFGKIGNITKESNIKIGDHSEMEIIKNKNLIFDVDNIASCLTIYLQHGDYKIGFSTIGIKPVKYSCQTSNAKVATCVVKDGYIVVKPKKKGKVKVTLSTEVNGKKYITTLDVEVKGHKSSSSSEGGNSQSTTNNDMPTGFTSSDNIVDSGDDYKHQDKEHDARLKSLSVDNYNLAPTFNPDVYNYVVAVPNNITSVTISGKTNSDKATIISGLGEVVLTGDSTIVKVKVKAYDGTTKTYTIKINKKDDISVVSTDSTLKELNVSDYALSPIFNKNTTSYKVTVPYSVTSLDLSAVANDNNALVVITGNSNFKVGSNNIVKVNVTAEDGSRTTYTINVTRLNKNQNETNANLSSLSVDGYILNPTFNKDTINYSINVGSDVNSIIVNAIPEVSSSTVKITGNTNLKAGVNTVVVNVKSKDGVEKNYIITVNKEADNTSKLTALSIEGYPFNETFDEDRLTYSVTIPHDVDNLNVLYTKKDEREKVTISGNDNLLPGDNVIEVKVEAEDGTSTTYIINVYREEDLTDFYITSGTTYKVGYKSNPTINDNYKTIIINSNILNGSLNVNKTSNGTITIDDGKGSFIKLESNNLDLEYIEDESGTTTYAIKVNYNSVGTKTIVVTGNRKGHEINKYNITFNVVEMFDVVIDANGGFFNAFASVYNLTFYSGEKLDLSSYNEAYKYANITNCTSYKLIGYDTDKTKVSNPTYNLNSTITVNSDMTLYAIFDPNDNSVIYKAKNRLYLTDVTIFELEDGTKNFIYPGTKGSYIMHIENTTDSKLTISSIKLEEDTICVSAGKCLNMGYILKQYNVPNDKYLFGASNDNYSILNSVGTLTSANHFEKEINLSDSDKIVLEPNTTSEAEITLLWKWVDSDWDTEIGDYVVNNNDLYTITISFQYETENKTCEE